jgi:murein DD-endopeptidase MepM/ murein hydrolase activator NlpD
LAARYRQVWLRTALFASGLAVAMLAAGAGVGAAWANDAGIRIMSDQRRAAPVDPVAGDFIAGGEPRAAVTFGRAADIEGALVDFSRVVRPLKPGGDAKAGAGGYTGPFAWPSRLPLNASVLTSGFGTRHHPILGVVRRHSGADLAAALGTPVKAPSPGVVMAAQWQGGYGLLVVVDHGRGVQTRYAHLSQVAVVPGQRVGLGDTLGYVGATGLATGPHLHYEMRLDGQAIDPIGTAPRR